jgi:hypothetical protein
LIADKNNKLLKRPVPPGANCGKTCPEAHKDANNTNAGIELRGNLKKEEQYANF